MLPRVFSCLVVAHGVWKIVLDRSEAARRDWQFPQPTGEDEDEDEDEDKNKNVAGACWLVK